MNNRSHWTLALLSVTITTSGCGAAPEESVEASTESALVMNSSAYYDGGSTTTVGGVTLHACPPDGPNTVGVMVGAHLAADIFRCQCVPFSQFAPGSAFLDGPDSPSHSISTVAGHPNLHRCPGGVMIGYDHNRNDLLCMKTAPGVITVNVTDNGTQDGFMHVCANLHDVTGNTAMTGIDAVSNVFLCSNT